jgi:hypothetical protein
MNRRTLLVLESRILTSPMALKTDITVQIRCLANPVVDDSSSLVCGPSTLKVKNDAARE